MRRPLLLSLLFLLYLSVYVAIRCARTETVSVCVYSSDVDHRFRQVRYLAVPGTFFSCLYRPVLLLDRAVTGLSLAVEDDLDPP